MQPLMILLFLALGQLALESEEMAYHAFPLAWYIALRRPRYDGK